MNVGPAPEVTVVAKRYQVGDLIIDTGMRRVTRAGAILDITGRTFDLLLALVRVAPNLVSTQDLFERVWPGLVVTPDALTQRIKILRQTLGDNAESPRYVAAVRGHGYCIATEVATLAVPSALSADHPSIKPRIDANGTRPWIPVLLALVLGAGGVWWAFEPHGGASVGASGGLPPASIAVLPFANLTGDPSREYLSDGIAEEMIHALAQVPGLKVPARTSSFAYKGRNIDIRRIAQDLGVSTVLEGSVRSAGARIRITAQLVDAQSGYQIWSQTYDRQSGDIFRLEDDLASAILQAFRTSLKVDLPAPTPGRPPTQDLDAYQLYLQADSFPNGSPQSFLAAIALDDEALRHDPKFARALEQRAFMRAALLWQGYPLIHGIEDAQQDAEQTLMLDPSMAEAHAVLGTLMALRREWQQAEAEFRTAIAADPREGAMRVQYAASVLLATGQLRKAHVEAVEGYRLAPGNPITAAMLALVDQAMGSAQDAAKFSDLAIAQGASPSERETVYTVAAARRGDYSAAADHAVKALSSAVLARGGAEAVRMACAALADPMRQPAALHSLDGLTHDPAWKSGDFQSRQFVLYLYARFGVLDKLYEQLDQLLPGGGTTHSEIVAVGSLWFPEMRAFRQDPRFQEMVTQLKMIDYWKQYGPPDGCELKDRQLICR